MSDPTTVHIAASLAAVESAMTLLRPDTRDQAPRLHDGFLTARGIDQAVIDDHWAHLATNYPEAPPWA